MNWGNTMSILQTAPVEGQYSTQIDDSDLIVTAAARQKISELIADTDDEIQAVRVYVAGGGCSGMNYGMTFTESATDYDRVLDGGEFKLLVDAVALNYLHGAEIDYVEDGANATFVFNNVFQAVGGSGACGGCGGAF